MTSMLRTDKHQAPRDQHTIELDTSGTADDGRASGLVFSSQATRLFIAHYRLSVEINAPWLRC